MSDKYLSPRIEFFIYCIEKQSHAVEIQLKLRNFLADCEAYGEDPTSKESSEVIESLKRDLSETLAELSLIPEIHRSEITKFNAAYDGPDFNYYAESLVNWWKIAPGGARSLCIAAIRLLSSRQPHRHSRGEPALPPPFSEDTPLKKIEERMKRATQILEKIVKNHAILPSSTPNASAQPSTRHYSPQHEQVEEILQPRTSSRLQEATDSDKSSNYASFISDVDARLSDILRSRDADLEHMAKLESNIRCRQRSSGILMDTLAKEAVSNIIEQEMPLNTSGFLVTCKESVDAHSNGVVTESWRLLFPTLEMIQANSAAMTP